MKKDNWIQEAKALLFDFLYSSAEDSLKREARQLIIKGGGYNPEEETSSTQLRWRENNETIKD